MVKQQTSCPESNLRLKARAWVVALSAGALLFVLSASQVSAQPLRRPGQIQKKLEKRLDRQGGNQNQPAPAGENNSASPAETVAPKAATPQAEKHSLDGIRQRGIRSFFTPEEATLIIPGFGQSPVALLIIFRQLDLTPAQKENIRALRRRVGRSLAQMRTELVALDGQLDEALYGTNDPASLDHYDPKRVEELADKVAAKRAEMMKLQTSIESQLRQILTPDQFYVFKELLRELMLPGRRPGLLPPARQQQLPRRMGPPPNQPNPPEKN